MALINHIEQELTNINAENGGDLIFDEPAIQKHLLVDAQAYKGLGIKLLSIVGGLLANLFFLGFIVISLHNSSEWIIVFGLMAIAGAIWIDKVADSTFLDAACIGAYLAGCSLLGYGANQLSNSDNLTTILLLLIAIATPLITSGFMLNFFAVLMVSGCLFALANINNAYWCIHLLCAFTAMAYVAVNLYEAKLLAYSKAVNSRLPAVLNGLLFSFIALLLYITFDWNWRIEHFHNKWISSGFIIATIFYLINHIITSLNITGRAQILIYLLSLIVLLPAIFAPTICGALLILLVSFNASQRTGLIIGIITLIYFVGEYYYSLQYSLLIKAEIMFATGLLFLLAWFILKKQLKSYEQN